MGNSKVRLFLIFAAFILTVCLAYLVVNIQVNKTAHGTALISPKASFFIPISNPIKAFLFTQYPTELEQIVQDNIKDSDTTYGIYIKNLSTGQIYVYNGNETFTSASLYKLAVMYTLYDLANQGKIDIEKPDIKDNLNAMITYSSNEAAVYLVETYSSWDEITQKMNNIGLTNTSFVDDLHTTPNDMGRLLEMISDGKAINLDSSISMLDLMSKQQINDRIPAKLPKNEKLIIAHKTGELDDVRHDVGVVITPEQEYIIVLMSKDSPIPEEVKPVMAQISKEVYDFFQSQWSTPPEIF